MYRSKSQIDAIKSGIKAQKNSIWKTRVYNTLNEKNLIIDKKEIRNILIDLFGIKIKL